MSPVLRMCLDPDPVTPHSIGTRELHCRPIHRCLTYSSFEDDDDTPTNEIPFPDSTLPGQYLVDTIQQSPSKYTPEYICKPRRRGRRRRGLSKQSHWNTEHWNMEEISDRHLCIHEHSLPHGLCLYPCPYTDFLA